MAAQLLHTPDEAAVILRCTASWLKDKARLREIPFTKVGGSYHFTDAHLLSIIERFEVEPEQPRAAAPRRRTATAASPAGTVRHLAARPPKRARAAS